MPFWDRQIDLVFISHPQKDHNGALAGLLKRYRVGKVVQIAKENDVYRYRNLYFDILNKVEASASGQILTGGQENEDSMVVFLKYVNFSVLFTADIGEPTELALIEKGLLAKTTVLKVPHHGSKYSSSLAFLWKLSPRLAVVSVGTNNTYGHPNGDTLMRLDQVGAKVLRTDKVGTVEIISDGDDLKVVSER
jgi:competence protein ComEC